MRESWKARLHHTHPAGTMSRHRRPGGPLRTVSSFVLSLCVLASIVAGPATAFARPAAASSQPSESPSPTPTESPNPAPTDAPTPAESPSPDPSPSEAPAPSETTAPAPEPSPSESDPPAPTTAPSETTPSDPSPSTPDPSPSDSPTPSGPATPLIVRLVPGLSGADQQAAIARGGGTESTSIPALRMHLVDVPASTVGAALDAYASDPAVESVDRDRTRDAEAAPSDPAYLDQWALPQIGWDDAYGNVSPGGSATIAVLDTGVDAGTADVAGRLVPGFSVFEGSDATSDPNGHGTWLASIAAAETDNGAGIAGIGYAGVRIMPVQVLDAAGTGQDSDIIQGVVWAADHGAGTILMGFSNPGYSQALQDAVEYAWSHGAVLVAATGNDGSSAPTYPAGDAKVMGVSATDQSDALASFSNSGADTLLGAPGVGIVADAVGGGTTTISGTSASAAIVAGAAALLRANDPGASNATIVGRLARNADPAGSPNETGNGRVNLVRALADTSGDGVVPVGAPGGGPIVGPYVAASNAIVSGNRQGNGNRERHRRGDRDCKWGCDRDCNHRRRRRLLHERHLRGSRSGLRDLDGLGSWVHSGGRVDWHDHVHRKRKWDLLACPGQPDAHASQHRLDLGDRLQRRERQRLARRR